MKHIIKAVEHERVRNAISWDLTIYDDKKREIYEISEFQYLEEEKH